MPLFFFKQKLEREREREREKSTQIVEHLFCGMSGWYNANFSKKHNKGIYGVHVNLDHESMTKNSLEGHNNLTKLNAKTSSICVSGFQEVSSYELYQRGALQGFYKFSKYISQALKQ